MTFPRSLAALFLMAVGFVASVQAGQVNAATFNSPLVFKGTQWKVKSSVGPVYLARMEGGAWKVLAIFDGTKGEYHLDWEAPAGGLYSAVDSRGVCSETVRISETRSPIAGVSAAPETFRPSNAQELTEYHLRMQQVYAVAARRG
jgi:hypothetical protein